eukprot:768575-Hanusia_phi.AAC.7
MQSSYRRLPADRVVPPGGQGVHLSMPIVSDHVPIAHLPNGPPSGPSAPGRALQSRADPLAVSSVLESSGQAWQTPADPISSL